MEKVAVRTMLTPGIHDPYVRNVPRMDNERFIRPVTYQNFPDDLLPQPLRERNPLRPWRLVDGGLTQQ
jgi:NADP-dependent aldehyde dehydrogenase